MAMSDRRTVLFSLSTALAENQGWAVDAFPEIVRRATGYNDRWVLQEKAVDHAGGVRTWRYDVQGLPQIDLVVDHIVHELTDAVVLQELHTVTEDAYTFGSMKRDRPARGERADTGQLIGGEDR